MHTHTHTHTHIHTHTHAHNRVNWYMTRVERCTMMETGWTTSRRAGAHANTGDCRVTLFE